MIQATSNSNSNVFNARTTGNTSTAAPAPSGEQKDTVSVANYNVENWFAPEDANAELGKRPKPQYQLDKLAENIKQSGAKVVTLNEVGTSLKNVKAFFDTKFDGKFPYVAMEGTNDARGVHVAIASQYPITNVVSHTNATFPLADGSGDTKFSRDLLRADIDVKGTPMTVYTTHAKSRRVYAANDPAHPGGTNPDNQRIAEGQATTSIVHDEMKQYPGRLYVVMGDLNDGTEDKSVQAIMNPTNGPKMFDTLEGLSKQARRTWPSDPSKGHGHEPVQFDHILVPADQHGKLVESHIVNIPGVSQAASDHLELEATFNLAK